MDASTVPTDHAPSFGAWLKKRRKSLDLTQEQLADRVGCSLATIAKIEAGERRPSHQMAELLATCLRLPTEQLEAFLELAREAPGAHGQESGPPLLVRPNRHEPPPQLTDAVRGAKRAGPTNLPAPLTSLLGREEQVEAVRTLFRKVRLLTLTGAPGIGKTRLALQMAAEMHGEFPDGVYFIELAPINDPQLVAPMVANTLGLKEVAGKPLLELLKERLADRVTLLVLDNFEQVLDAAPTITELLAACAGLKVLVTSREALHLYGEQQFQVPPLAIPYPATIPYVPYMQSDPLVTASPSPASRVSADSIQILLGYSAVALFVDRAREVQPDFALTEQNASAVALICTRLDGLPLAIELAAAHVKLLPPPLLLARLSSRLKTLVGGARDLPARQQTLVGTLDWSYDLLNHSEKLIFARMAVFSGGESLAAVEAVCNYDGRLGEDTLWLVESLVSKSLVRESDGPRGESRCSMLETMREYASEKLKESGENSALSRAHAEYYLALVEGAEDYFYSAEQKAWFNRLDQDHDNLRSALQWTLDRGQTEHAARFAVAMYRFWYAHGYLSEGRRWVEQAVVQAEAQRGSVALSLWSRLLNTAGIMARAQGDLEHAQKRYEEALALARETGDKHRITQVLNNLGLLANAQGDYERATELLEESLSLERELGNAAGVASSLHNLGVVVGNQGNYQRAVELYEESLKLRREQGNIWGIAATLNNLAEVLRRQGRYEEATISFEDSLAVFRELNDRASIAEVVKNLADLACDTGNYERARRLYEQAAELQVEVGDKQGLASCLAGFASVAALQERPERAARLFGSVNGLLQTIGATMHSVARADCGRYMAAIRDELDEDRFKEAWDEGRAMTMEQAIAYALEDEWPV